MPRSQTRKSMLHPGDVLETDVGDGTRMQGSKMASAILAKKDKGDSVHLSQAAP